MISTQGVVNTLHSKEEIMMGFKFTDEQLALKDLAREFFEKEVRPVMAELDARPNPKDCYPYELVRKGSEIGLRTLSIPEEYGGAGTNTVTQCLVFTTMCETEAGTGKIFSQCWKVMRSVMEVGTEEQKKLVLTEFAADPDYVCSYVASEPNSGSDNVSPYNAPPGSGISTTAIQDGNYFVLNGTKHMISLAGFSKLLLVWTRTSPNLPANDGLTGFLVPADLPGISYGQVHNKLGWRLYPNGEIFFDKVRVPKEFMLGELNRGVAVRAKINRGDLESAGMILGICKAIYRIAFDHAKNRIQGGTVIFKHPTVASMLSDMAMMIDILETYYYDAAYSAQNDPNFDRKRARFATIFARECVLKMIAHGLDITASSGIMHDHPMEKLVRDGLSVLHAAGTSSLFKVRMMSLLKQV
jgi:alkylation response protein AidB-like acyl-CoA dehydrogenase